jgi:hypothetical protein
MEHFAASHRIPHTHTIPHDAFSKVKFGRAESKMHLRERRNACRVCVECSFFLFLFSFLSESFLAEEKPLRYIRAVQIAGEHRIQPKNRISIPKVTSPR